MFRGPMLSSLRTKLLHQSTRYLLAFALGWGFAVLSNIMEFILPNASRQTSATASQLCAATVGLAGLWNG